MNKKTATLLVVIVFFAALLMLRGRGGSGSKDKDIANASSVSITEAAFGNKIPQFDFGMVSMANGKVAHDFALVNNFGSDITITQAVTSCMCTEAVIRMADGNELGPFGMPGMGFTPTINAPVKSGEKITVRAVFDPAAHGPSGIGPTERAIMLTTDKGQYQLNFKVVVTP